MSKEGTTQWAKFSHTTRDPPSFRTGPSSKKRTPLLLACLLAAAAVFGLFWSLVSGSSARWQHCRSILCDSRLSISSSAVRQLPLFFSVIKRKQLFDNCVQLCADLTAVGEPSPESKPLPDLRRLEPILFRVPF